MDSWVTLKGRKGMDLDNATETQETLLTGLFCMVCNVSLATDDTAPYGLGTPTSINNLIQASHI